MKAKARHCGQNIPDYGPASNERQETLPFKLSPKWLRRWLDHGADDIATRLRALAAKAPGSLSDIQGILLDKGWSGRNLIQHNHALKTAEMRRAVVTQRVMWDTYLGLSGTARDLGMDVSRRVTSGHT